MHGIGGKVSKEALLPPVGRPGRSVGKLAEMEADRFDGWAMALTACTAGRAMGRTAGDGSWAEDVCGVVTVGCLTAVGFKAETTCWAACGCAVAMLGCGSLGGFGAGDGNTIGCGWVTVTAGCGTTTGFRLGGGS